MTLVIVWKKEFKFNQTYLDYLFQNMYSFQGGMWANNLLVKQLQVKVHPFYGKIKNKKLNDHI